MIFNSRPLSFKPCSYRIAEDWPEVNLKYADMTYAQSVLPSWWNLILDSAPIEENHKKILVDVKVHNLKKGQVPCIPGWHLDGYFDPRTHKNDHIEVYHIIAFGGASLTHFMTDPIELELPASHDQKSHMQHFEKQIEKINPPFMSLTEGTWLTYDRFTFHRGAPASFDEKRLLIRVCETDMIQSNNRPFEVSYHYES